MKLDDIEQGLRTLGLGTEHREIRVLRKNAAPKSGIFSSPKEAAFFAYTEAYDSNTSGVYVSLNPPALPVTNSLKPVATGQAVSDSDIVKRTRLVVDVDPIRQGRKQSTPATVEEREAAIISGHGIMSALKLRGWSAPAYLETPNGFQMWWAIDLPNDQESTTLIARVLYTLSHLFSDDNAKVDVSMFNASRISRIPGTIGRKGDDEKMWREAGPTTNEPGFLETELLQQLVDEYGITAPNNSYDNSDCPLWNGEEREVDHWLDSWLTRHNVPCSEDKRQWKKGNGWFKTMVCPWDAGHDTKCAYVGINGYGKIFAGCFGERCNVAGNRWPALRMLYEPDAYDWQRDWCLQAAIMRWARVIRENNGIIPEAYQKNVLWDMAKGAAIEAIEHQFMDKQEAVAYTVTKLTPAYTHCEVDHPESAEEIALRAVTNYLDYLQRRRQI